MAGNLVADSTAPTVTWEDTDSGAADFRIKSGGNILILEIDENGDGSGWEQLWEWRATEATSAKNITISNTNPILTLEDTSTTNGNDFRLRADGNVFYLDVNTGTWDGVLDVTPSEVRFFLSTKIRGTAPKLTEAAGTTSWSTPAPRSRRTCPSPSPTA